MSSYRGTADRPAKTKAVVGVIAVHAALALIIISGLNVPIVQHAVERLQTFDIREPPPPPPPEPPPPPPRPQPERAKLEEGAAGKKAEPTPIVAPKPRIPIPSPIPAAPIAGTGSATTAGAADYGTGPGAGGSGTGRGGGGGGGGDTSGFTPARRITKIPDREYGRLSSTGIRRGSVGVTIKVNTDGSVSNCRVARTSGDSSIDSLMCDLTLRYIRFEPARDDRGRPIAQDVTFYPNWYR